MARRAAGVLHRRTVQQRPCSRTTLDRVIGPSCAPVPPASQVTRRRVTTRKRPGVKVNTWSRTVARMADLRYELSFKGAASPTLRAAFTGFEVRTGNGITFVRCTQDALSAVIDRIQELGLELLDVRLIAEPESTHRPPSPA